MHITVLDYKHTRIKSCLVFIVYLALTHRVYFLQDNSMGKLCFLLFLCLPSLIYFLPFPFEYNLIKLPYLSLFQSKIFSWYLLRFIFSYLIVRTLFLPAWLWGNIWTLLPIEMLLRTALKTHASLVLFLFHWSFIFHQFLFPLSIKIFLFPPCLNFFFKEFQYLKFKWCL